MPCGGHDIGLNIWAESGSIYFYACQSGWFDENNMLLKAGRFRIDFSNPLQNSGFQQTLDLYNGYVTIKDAKHEVRLWVDTFSPIIYIELLQTNGDDINFSYETWRHKDRLVTKDECQQNSWKWDIPKNCTTFADSIIADKHSLIFFHQNRAETVFDYTVKKEGLDSVKTLLYNPIGERRMEGRIIAPNFNFSGISYGIIKHTLLLKKRQGNASFLCHFLPISVPLFKCLRHSEI